MKAVPALVVRQPYAAGPELMAITMAWQQMVVAISRSLRNVAMR